MHCKGRPGEKIATVRGGEGSGGGGVGVGRGVSLGNLLGQGVQWGLSVGET